MIKKILSVCEMVSAAMILIDLICLYVIYEKMYGVASIDGTTFIRNLNAIVSQYPCIIYVYIIGGVIMFFPGVNNWYEYIKKRKHKE